MGLPQIVEAAGPLINLDSHTRRSIMSATRAGRSCTERGGRDTEQP